MVFIEEILRVKRISLPSRIKILGNIIPIQRSVLLIC